MSEKSQSGQALPPNVADRLGRVFNLMFNRVSMYSMDHPSTKETVQLLAEALQEGLRFVSPLTVVLEREKIYVEEEPLDPRVSAQRLVSHMKKAGVQSVSFERGLTQKELAAFGRLFGDPKTYPTAEHMKQGLLKSGVQNIRVNHVFFKKMTADDEVVDREELLRSTGGFGLGQVIIDVTGASGSSAEAAQEKKLSDEESLFDRLFQDLTLARLVEDPSSVIKRLLGTGAESSEAPQEPDARGQALIQGIRKLKAELEKPRQDLKDTQAMGALVEAVFKLREEVQEGVEARAQKGEILADQSALSREMDDLTDQVMVQLVREEYRKGQISVKRLAQILRRMMPDLRELKRLLPKLKEALLADGMPLADYLQLIRELERELQSENLALILEEGAEEIGLSAADLLSEMKKDPKGAAELIALAAEIRSMGNRQDPNILARILVDYVEQISGGLALEQAQMEGPEGGRRLGEMISRIQEELVSRLKARLGESSVVRKVEQEVRQRNQKSLDELKREWLFQLFLGGKAPQGRVDVQTVLQAVNAAYPEQEGQAEVLDSVMQAMEAKGLDTAPLRAALAQRARLGAGEPDPQKPPKGAFNRNTILFWLREEVKRGHRYPYVFSLLLLSVKRAVALRPVPLGLIKPHEVRNALVQALIPMLRDVDLVGCLEENKVVVLLPFTGKNGVQVVRRRVLEALEGKTLEVRNVPMRINLTLADETFQKERAKKAQLLVAQLEAKLAAAMKQS
jgi:hypothetical protein